MTTHALEKALKDAKPAFGAWITLPGAINAWTVARSSPHLSWVLIDCEHGLPSLLPGAAESVQAIAGLAGAAPSVIVRISATGANDSTSWQIKHALDAGASGVLVPMVSDATMAKKIASECRFPPDGVRGFGSPFTHAIWGISSAEYRTSANEHVFAIVQIETKEGVDNVEEIAAVDGIDVLFIGPFDLSLSLGYPLPSPDPHPEVERIIQRILKVVHGKGKKCAIFCSTGAQGFKRAQEGFDMINVALDANAMSESIARHLNDAVHGQ